MKKSLVTLALGAALALSPLGFSLDQNGVTFAPQAAHARKGADDGAAKTAADDKGGQRARADKAAKASAKAAKAAAKAAKKAAKPLEPHDAAEAAAKAAGTHQ